MFSYYAWRYSRRRTSAVQVVHEEHVVHGHLQVFLPPRLERLCEWASTEGHTHTNTHTHTDTHTERERERERESVCVCVRVSMCALGKKYNAFYRRSTHALCPTVCVGYTLNVCVRYTHTATDTHACSLSHCACWVHTTYCHWHTRMYACVCVCVCVDVDIALLLTHTYVCMHVCVCVCLYIHRERESR